MRKMAITVCCTITILTIIYTFMFYNIVNKEYSETEENSYYTILHKEVNGVNFLLNLSNGEIDLVEHEIYTKYEVGDTYEDGAK